MKKLIKKEESKLEERIKKVNGAMTQEGMPLTKEDIDALTECILGKTTYEIERQKILERCKKNGKSL